MEAMENIKLILIRNMKGRRKLLKMNQEELAEKSGLSTGYIKNIERGISWPSPESFEAISKGLSVSISDLLISSSPTEKKAPVSQSLKMALNVPDEVYNLANELELDHEVWEDIIETLEIAVEDRRLNKKG